MIEVNKERRIEVYGVCFSGVSELKKVALSGNPKNGVYVGVQMERYPCFDSSDYAYENRYYTHFVFARCKEELELKLDVLNNPEKYKGIDNKESILTPMVYWNGDTDDPMVVPECDEILVHEKREKIKPFTTQQCKDKTRLERLMDQLPSAIAEAARSNDLIRRCTDAGYNFKYVYFDKNNKEILNVTLTPDEYRQ